MQLDRTKTKILVEEQAIEEMAYITEIVARTRVFWVASLDGVTSQGESVRMERSSDTPDDALKRLFEAMTGAGITL